MDRIKAKMSTCVYCNIQKEVSIFSPDVHACEDCLAKGLQNPDKRSSDDAQRKREDTFKEKYGEINPQKVEDIKNKTSETNIEKYGGTGFASDELRTKGERTSEERYGSKNYMSSEDGAKNWRENFIKKYGVDNPLKVSSIREKVSQKLKGIESKQKGRTYEEIYGKERANELKRRKSEDFINNNFSKHLLEEMQHRNIRLLDERYINAHFKHKWQCLKCNNLFEQKWNKIQQGYSCPVCFPRPNRIDNLRPKK